MESLLLKDKIITLEGIRKQLYNIMQPELVEDMTLVPNGLYRKDYLTINSFLTCGDYRDSVVLIKDSNEYPMFYSANCRGDNPICVTYGKKMGERLILLQEMFHSASIYTDNPILGRCSFIDMKASLAYGKYCKKLKETELYHMYKNDSDSGMEAYNNISKEKREVIEESVETFQKVFKIKKTKMNLRNPW